MASDLRLMAVTLPSVRDWFQSAIRAASGAGFAAHAEKRCLLLWRDRIPYGEVSFADGWIVQRIWLAPGRSALGLLARRIYFSSGDGVPLALPEHEALGGRRRPVSRSASEELVEQQAVLRELCTHLGAEVGGVDLDLVDNDLGSARRVTVKSRTFQCPPEQLNDIYRQHGFDDVHPDFTVLVCPFEGVPKGTAQRFAGRIRSCCEARHSTVRTRIIAPETVMQRASELTAAGESGKKGHCVLFVLPGKECLLDERGRRVFEVLHKSGMPFRRAYADDPLEYSIPDQLGSLVMAAGGRPHRSNQPIPDLPIWTVGVDLAHPRGANSSVLVMTLVDHAGRLVGAWRTSQPRDETVRDPSIKRLLGRCRHALLSLDKRPNVMVLRDGRLFENDTSDLYSNYLGDALTLIEVRKRGNPQVFESTAEDSVALAPFAAKVADSNTLFLSTTQVRGSTMLPNILKVSWREDWNRLRLDHGQIARLVTASSAAPGLGLHAHHLPAAIYWADGIAGANWDDLRFIGIPVESLSGH